MSVSHRCPHDQHPACFNGAARFGCGATGNWLRRLKDFREMAASMEPHVLGAVQHYFPSEELYLEVVSASMEPHVLGAVQHYRDPVVLQIFINFGGDSHSTSGSWQLLVKSESIAQLFNLDVEFEAASRT